MASFRFKQVADAASGGLDLFIGREAEREKRKLDQDWAMALEELRESRAVAREERQTEAQAERDRLTNEFRVAQTEAATARHTATQSRIVEEGKLNREQAQRQFEDTGVQRQIENHYKRVDERREALQKQLEDPMIALEPGAKDSLIAKNEAEIAQDTVDFVNRMSRHNKRGFEAKAPEELSSLYQTFGVPGQFADKAAADTGLFPTIETVPAPGQPKWTADGRVDSTGQPVEEVMAAPGATGPASASAAASMPSIMRGPEQSAPSQAAENLLFPDRRNMYSADLAKWFSGVGEKVNAAGARQVERERRAAKSQPGKVADNPYLLMGQQGRR